MCRTIRICGSVLHSPRRLIARALTASGAAIKLSVAGIILIDRVRRLLSAPTRGSAGELLVPPIGVVSKRARRVVHVTSRSGTSRRDTRRCSRMAFQHEGRDDIAGEASRVSTCNTVIFAISIFDNLSVKL